MTAAFPTNAHGQPPDPPPEAPLHAGGTRALRVGMLVLVLIGLGIAGYTTYVHYAGIKPSCLTGGSCEQVQTSAYAKLLGVPVALIGLIGYTAILGSLLVPQGENARLATAAFTLIGFAFSAYLTYREIFSIHAICEWCVSSFGVLTVLACLAVWRFLRGAPPDTGTASSTAATASTAGGASPTGQAAQGEGALSAAP